jgi:integrase
MKHLDAKQVLTLLEVARENSTRDWAMFLLTFRHALRSHEIRSLKLDDINLADGTIRVERVKGSNSGVQTLEGHSSYGYSSNTPLLLASLANWRIPIHCATVFARLWLSSTPTFTPSSARQATRTSATR